MATLEPIKASLIADLVDLINENLADLLQVKLQTCPDCNGRGTVGGESRTSYDGGHGGPLTGSHSEIIDDGTLATCATCGGVGAREAFVIDHEKLKTRRFGRLVEGFEVKQGVIVPKMRSKDKAFAMLVKLLGFDKAVVEIAGAATFNQSLSQDQREEYLEQLKELATLGLLDGSRA
jgi:hypothetical protein